MSSVLIVSTIKTDYHQSPTGQKIHINALSFLKIP
nr:MAG TPA: hypothetical protein [Caudoviricetes sp.]